MTAEKAAANHRFATIKDIINPDHPAINKQS